MHRQTLLVSKFSKSREERRRRSSPDYVVIVAEQEQETNSKPEVANRLGCLSSLCGAERND